MAKNEMVNADTVDIGSWTRSRVDDDVIMLLSSLTTAINTIISHDTTWSKALKSPHVDFRSMVVVEGVNQQNLIQNLSAGEALFAKIHK
jgi:hypothetical protein